LDSISYAAAAVGVFITSSETVNARFSATMDYDYNWVDWPIGVTYVASSGGVGVLILSGGDTVIDQRAELWSDAELIAGNTGQGSGYLVNTAGQNYFTMQAGVTYLAWVWRWATAALSPLFTGSTGLAGGGVNCT